MSDMDLIIMGGYYGVGNYAKKVVGFLVGVAEKTNEGFYLFYVISNYSYNY